MTGCDRGNRGTRRSGEVGAGQTIAGRSAAGAPGDQHKGDHEEQGGRDRNRRQPHQATLAPGWRRPGDNFRDHVRFHAWTGVRSSDLGPVGQDQLRVAGGLHWHRPGQRSRQLLDAKGSGEQRPVGVGWQVVAAVFRVEHDHPTAVVAAELLTGNASVLDGYIDHDHIGRWPTRGQLGRRANHLQLALLNDQGEQRGARPLSPVKQGDALRQRGSPPPQVSLVVGEVGG